ncbi:hypothetical protein MLD38_040369 [Melastoma candidum]|uniref:Uncharacterized protein n=1 Tax=Melastoma candidum TaxID=119954 RepID=A0ACB9L657_9MYRT|nr:hypothetical protein MLD38_040369 [Melastoma candidum]
MQNRKKESGRISARDLASPKFSRVQKKVSGNAEVADKKASQLITSSPRRQKSSTILQKKKDAVLTTKSANNTHRLVHEKKSGVCLPNDTIDDNSFHQEACEEGETKSESDTIFSPAFHAHRNFERVPQNGDDMSRSYPAGPKCLQQNDVEFSLDKVGDVKFSSEHFYEDGCTSMSKTCSNNMEIDDNRSPEKSDASDTEMVLEQDTNAENHHIDMVADDARLSSEASAVYLAMKNSKLECVDEQGQDAIEVEVCARNDDIDDYDDFDPYLFIKNLPDLSSVVPSFRPMLLPKQTRSCPSTTLVLDLDETLVHSTLEHCDDADFTFPVNFNLQEHTVYVRCRPHLRDFMERVSSLFEIIIFTASQSIYAEQLLNVLDPRRKIFRHRVYRDSCVYVDGNYLKDLSVLGRDLARVIIIDNSPQAFGFQVDNGIPIESWFDDRSDKELLLLLPFLESLVGAEDVRTVIAKRYNLRQKIASAVYPPLN